jgi:hypothetical protein
MMPAGTRTHPKKQSPCHCLSSPKKVIGVGAPFCTPWQVGSGGPWDYCTRWWSDTIPVCILSTMHMAVTTPHLKDTQRLIADQETHLHGPGDDMELQGLLSGVQTQSRAQKHGAGAHGRTSNQPWSAKRMAGVGLALIVLILGASIAPSWFEYGTRRHSAHPNSSFGGKELRSNGTHDFKRTVLIVSIDGLRSAYIAYRRSEY